MWLPALFVATAGFAAVSMWRASVGLPPQDHLLLIPFGLGTAVGAAIFGVGMTLAGMCAAGTLQRLGEGYVIAWASLLGILLGAAFDPFRRFTPMSWQLQSSDSGLWLGQSVGAPVAAGAAVVAVAVAWKLLRGKGAPKKVSLLTPTIIGGAVLGVINTLQMAVETPWTVAWPLGLIPPAMAGAVPRSEVTAAVPLLVLDVGLVLGSAFGAATGERYRLRWPRRTKEVLTTLVGGVLMGWGIQLARGCSIGGGVSAFASLSASAVIFLPCLFLGAWLGAQVVRKLG